MFTSVKQIMDGNSARMVPVESIPLMVWGTVLDELHGTSASGSFNGPTPEFFSLSLLMMSAERMGELCNETFDVIESLLADVDDPAQTQLVGMCSDIKRSMLRMRRLQVRLRLSLLHLFDCS